MNAKQQWRRSVFAPLTAASRDFQAALDAYTATAAYGATVDDKSLTRWLEPSFWALPTDQHRQMFLDAATLMHGQPQAHLRAAWSAHVQLDRGWDDNAAGRVTTSLLAELLNSSLVTIDLSKTDQQADRCVQC